MMIKNLLLSLFLVGTILPSFGADYDQHLTAERSQSNSRSSVSIPCVITYLKGPKNHIQQKIHRKITAHIEQ